MIFIFLIISTFKLLQLHQKSPTKILAHLIKYSIYLNDLQQTLGMLLWLFIASVCCSAVLCYILCKNSTSSHSEKLIWAIPAAHKLLSLTMAALLCNTSSWADTARGTLSCWHVNYDKFVRTIFITVSQLMVWGRFLWNFMEIEN